MKFSSMLKGFYTYKQVGFIPEIQAWFNMKIINEIHPDNRRKKAPHDLFNRYRTSI